MDCWIWILFRKIRKKKFSCSWATRRTQFRKILFRVSKRVGYTIEYRYELTNVVRVSNEEKLCRIALWPHFGRGNHIWFEESNFENCLEANCFPWSLFNCLIGYGMFCKEKWFLALRKTYLRFFENLRFDSIISKSLW